MTGIPHNNKPGPVAVEREHCGACYRLIHPSQTYYLTIEYEPL